MTDMRGHRRWAICLAVLLAAAAGSAEVLADRRSAEWNLEVREDNSVLWAGKGWARDYDGLRVAYFTGTPMEIGAQMYHLIVQPREAEMMAAFEAIQDRANTGTPIVKAFKDVYARLKFVPAFKRFIPREYLDELIGFKLAASKGKVRSITDLIMANAAVDLGLVYGGCSAAAAWGGGTAGGDMVVGRNLDESSLKDLAHLQSLNFYAPREGLKFATVNYPALVGVMHGMNENGLVIAMDFSKAVREELSIDGLPFAVMLRRALQYGRDLDEAVKLIREAPRTVGLNILVADARQRQAAVVEVSAHRMAVRRGDEFIYQANRFKTEYMSRYQTGGWLGSAFREARFEKLLEALWGQIDVGQMVEIMRDKNDPGAAGGAGLLPGIHNAGTIASMVFNPTRLEVWTSASGGFMAPDAAFIGFSARDVWEAGRPVEPLGVIPPVAPEGYARDWRTVMEASLETRDERIIELLGPVADRYPDAQFPLYLLGLSDLKIGRTIEGFALLERAVSLPQIPEPFYLMQSHFWLGVFYDTEGSREHAVEHYHAALAVKVPDVQGDYANIRGLCSTGLERPLIYRRNNSATKEGGR